MVSAGEASVFYFALLTAAATGHGAAPFAFTKHPTRRWLGASNAVAAGLMLAASFDLIYEGMDYWSLCALTGALLGLVFIALARRNLRQDEHPAIFASISGLDARKALLTVGVMTLHSFTESVGIGVSSVGPRPRALHKPGAGRPQRARGARHQPRPRAAWSGADPRRAVEHLLQPAPALMAVPAFYFVEVFRPLLPYGLGFAAGAMIWVVFSELVPDALEEASSDLVAVMITVSAVAMVAFVDLYPVGA